MTREEFLILLEHNKRSAADVHFETSVADGWYVLRNYHRWEVFFRERGQDYDCVGFPSESNALEFLSERLIRK